MKNNLFLFLLTASVLASCNNGSQNQNSVTRELITIERCTVQVSEAYAANVQGRQDVRIYPQVSGKIEKINVCEGQAVVKGQVLFVIDQIPYQAALRVADANTKVAKQEVEIAKLELSSKQALFEENVVSAYDLAMAQNTLAKAQALLEQAQAQLLNASNNLSYCLVKSPVDGVVGTLPYRVGALVGSNMESPLTTVSDNSELFIDFSMGENQFRALKAQFGSKDEFIRNLPEVLFRFSDGSLYDKPGKIQSISGVLNAATGTVNVRTVFPNPGGTILSGSIGNILLPYSFENAIVIPQQTCFEIQGKYFVQKVVDGVANTTEVTVKSVGDGRQYIVVSGLEAGDTIVASGAGLVRNGDIIK